MARILSSFEKRSITTVMFTILFTGISLVDAELEAAVKVYRQTVAAVEADKDGLSKVIALARETAGTFALCHGADGNGSNGHTKIAGQRSDYVSETLKLLLNVKPNKWRSRQSCLMTTTNRSLSNQEIVNLANYIASRIVATSAAG
jgi:cytochrome c553